MNICLIYYQNKLSKRKTMVKEYFILNSKSKKSDLNFNCFSNHLDVQLGVGGVFKNDNCKWTHSQSSSGTFLQAFYETELAHIKIEVMKTKRELPYIFHLTVLGGSNPLYEVARLCKVNHWNAYDTNEDEYLDLDNPVKLQINDSDRQNFYDDYWDKFNAVQEEKENEKFITREPQNKISRQKEWWKFW